MLILFKGVSLVSDDLLLILGVDLFLSPVEGIFVIDRRLDGEWSILVSMSPDCFKDLFGLFVVDCRLDGEWPILVSRSPVDCFNSLRGLFFVCRRFDGEWLFLVSRSPEFFRFLLGLITSSTGSFLNGLLFANGILLMPDFMSIDSLVGDLLE